MRPQVNTNFQPTHPYVEDHHSHLHWDAFLSPSLVICQWSGPPGPEPHNAAYFFGNMALTRDTRGAYCDSMKRGRRTTVRGKTITTRVTDELHYTISRIAEIENVTVSKCTSDLLLALLPGLQKTLSLLEESIKLDSNARNKLISTLERHEKHLSDTVDYVSQSINEELEKNTIPSLKLPI